MPLQCTFCLPNARAKPLALDEKKASRRLQPLDMRQTNNMFFPTLVLLAWIPLNLFAPIRFGILA
jgi:hypothetical protein